MSVCTVAADQVTLVALGTCTIDADQAGDATYEAAPQVSQSFEVTATPATVGYLRVTTNPAVPSQISINGVIADSWGLTWVKLSPGSYTIHFSHIEGYTEPADQTVSVTAGNTTTVAGAFTQRGSLHVTTSPAVAGTISVDGTPRNDWGMWTDIPTGSHQVCFGAVAGYTAPACQNVAVTAGSTTSVTGTYTVNAAGTGPTGIGYLRVTTNPAVPSQISINGVIADSWGLTWVKLSPGSYTIHFSHIEGYTEPADQTVSVTAGNTTTVDRCLHPARLTPRHDQPGRRRDDQRRWDAAQRLGHVDGHPDRQPPGLLRSRRGLHRAGLPERGRIRRLDDERHRHVHVTAANANGPA